ncbi:dickkopf-related protein 3-like [Ambystoma mexicanum]|uniref:dickkopf-related protein 3-like n=1 Tax=Ambystoma mexicanum TaxID=8296 RepID=UPI0037E7FE6B
MLHRLLLLPFLFPLVWRAAASPGFLPGGFQDAANIFREFSELMAKTQEETDKDFGDLENPVDFNQLPANYHNEEQDEHQVGNDTIYSHSKIDKVTDNETGDMLFSQKTVASFKKGYYGDDKPDKGCRNAEDCKKDQYCQASIFTNECRDCKAEGMVCPANTECCLGYQCAWGRCARVTRGESGTRCDPRRDECVPGLCCTLHKSLPFPVCAMPPGEGDKCEIPYGSLLKVIAWGAPASSTKGYCPCSQGLVCTNKGFNPFSTCEKPERKSGFVDIRKAPFVQAIIRRDEELADYDAEPLPWQLQGGQLAVVDLPGAAEESENEARESIKRLREDLEGGIGEQILPLDGYIEDAMGPSQLDFKELKKLANDMGQYFGPGFY